MNSLNNDDIYFRDLAREMFDEEIFRQHGYEIIGKERHFGGILGGTVVLLTPNGISIELTYNPRGMIIGVGSSNGQLGRDTSVKRFFRKGDNTHLDVVLKSIAKRVASSKPLIQAEEECKFVSEAFKKAEACDIKMQPTLAQVYLFPTEAKRTKSKDKVTNPRPAQVIYLRADKLTETTEPFEL
ncbi:MAG: hypothetical protein A2Y24_08330 [Clostridiales bacterium GWE2_32_10]|nr:MAG: hypothetical protein A2Y24_08330 [Clostridiales bacterium GWE2_32_10]HBY19483.1 hypothetical protein [Clostridiales bacterium]